MSRLGQRRRDVAGVNHAGVLRPGAVVGQVHSSVADTGQVLQFEHHRIGIGLGGHGGQGERGGGHGHGRVRGLWCGAVRSAIFALSACLAGHSPRPTGLTQAR